MIKLITGNKVLSQHVSQDTVAEFEESIRASGDVSVISTQSGLVTKAFRYAFTRYRLSPDRLPLWPREGVCFSVLMGPAFEKMFPHYLLAEHRNAYLFDAWPDKHDLILHFLRKSAIANVFFSSRQVAELISDQVTRTNVQWIPEGILPSRYKACEYDQRDIDVLQFGRKYEELHEQILQPLAAQSVRYLYERNRGKLVFATRHGFVDGLSRSKIVICVPSSMTHPNRAGQISTMTVRYLQAMVSKCLVVGIMPDEMKTLFPYTPLIELDRHNPAGQLLDILHNYHHYTDLIDRNYQYVCQHHTWAERWQTILPIIQPTEVTALTESRIYRQTAL